MIGSAMGASSLLNEGSSFKNVICCIVGIIIVLIILVKVAGTIEIEDNTKQQCECVQQQTKEME